MKIKERENQLEKWYEEFRDLPKLSFSDTKKLLKKLDDNKTVEFERKSIKDTIITGTLRQIYKYIKNSGLLLINSAAYETDDMISASYNVVIEDLENNTFLASSPTFAHYFGKTFINKMSEKLQISKINSQQVCNLNNAQMAQILKWYSNERKFENIPTTDDIQVYIRNNFELSEKLKADDLTTIDYLLKQIYTRSFKDEDDLEEISENKLTLIMPLLIESVINNRSGQSQLGVIESPEETIQKEMMYTDIAEQVFNSDKLTSKQKETLKAFYGIGQTSKKLAEIAEEEGLCPAAISGRHVNALKTLRKSKSLYKSFQEI